MNVMKLLESTSPIVRGKAFLVIVEVVKNNQEMLLLCCQSRCVAFICLNVMLWGTCLWKTPDQANKYINVPNGVDAIDINVH